MGAEEGIKPLVALVSWCNSDDSSVAVLRFSMRCIEAIAQISRGIVEQWQAILI